VRIAFFTAGTHGAGHRARGIALRRALSRAGFAGEYRMFGPPSRARAAGDLPDFPVLPTAAWEEVEIDATRLGSADAARATDLARQLAAFAPDVLVVDMFWAPLRHILPIAGCEAWLLLRSMPDAWLDGPPGAKFDLMQFARIISIEPIGSPAVTHAVDPVVIVNPEECQPRGALRARLGIAAEQRLVAVVHAGLPGETRELVPAAKAGDAVMTFDLRDPGAIFPLAEWIGDADEVHAFAGYNAYWESRWLGHVGRTMFRAAPRRNDDQEWRLAKCGRYVMRANGADTIAGWLVRGA
jgi:hypothetical protein